MINDLKLTLYNYLLCIRNIYIFKYKKIKWLSLIV